jgi:hypothetical protein
LAGGWDDTARTTHPRWQMLLSVIAYVAFIAALVFGLLLLAHT